MTQHRSDPPEIELKSSGSRPEIVRKSFGNRPQSKKASSSQKRSHRNSGQNRSIERSPALTVTISVTISGIVIRSHFQATFSQLLDNFRTRPDNFRATFGPSGQQIRGKAKQINSMFSPQSRWECRWFRIGGSSTIRNRMLLYFSSFDWKLVPELGPAPHFATFFSFLRGRGTWVDRFFCHPEDTKSDPPYGFRAISGRFPMRNN